MHCIWFMLDKNKQKRFPKFLKDLLSLCIAMHWYWRLSRVSLIIIITYAVSTNLKVFEQEHEMKCVLLCLDKTLLPAIPARTDSQWRWEETFSQGRSQSSQPTASQQGTLNTPELDQGHMATCNNLSTSYTCHCSMSLYFLLEDRSDISRE